MALEIIDIEKKYNAETALIILLLRNYFKTADQNQVVEFIDERKNKINWSKVKSLAAYHRIRPILYKELVNLNCIEIDFKNRLNVEIRQFTLRNFQLIYEAKRVIQLFQESGIKAIPYKGPFFSKEFYGDYDSREFSDIDLLIEWDDLKHCISILENEGYFPEDDFLKFYGDKTRIRENEFNMDYFENGIRKFHIELHWEIGNPQAHPLLGFRSLLKEIKNTCSQEGISIRLSKPALAFSTLIHHSIKDTFGLLRNITDLAQVFTSLDKKNQVELNYYLEKTSFKRQSVAAIQLSNTLFKLSIPIENKSLKINPELFIKLILESNYLNSIKKKLYYSYKKRLSLEKSNVNKFKIIYKGLKLLISPNINDYKWINLPKTLNILYYIIKPIRLIKNHLIYQVKNRKHAQAVFNQKL